MQEELINYVHPELLYFTIYQYHAKDRQVYSTAKRTYEGLVYIEQGEVTFFCGEQIIKGEPGNWFFIPRNAAYRSVWEGPDISYFTLDFQFCQKIISMCGPRITSITLQEKEYTRRPTMLTAQSSEAELMLKKIHRFFRSEKNGDNLLAASEFYRLWHKMSPLLLKETSDEVINAALHYLENHLSETFSLQELCRECCISKSSLFERFRKVTGTTPLQYRNAILARIGNEFLETGNYSVEQVSNMLHFSSPDYFRILYKKHYGCPPSRKKADGRA